MTLSPARYSRLQIGLHWGTLILLIVSFFSHEGMKEAWRAVERGTTDAPGIGALLHVWVGVAVLALTVIRIAVRLTHGVPDDMPNMPAVQNLLAKAAHLGLYGLLIALPASGALAWFGAVKEASGVHEVLFNLALAVLALHVVGALYHQFFLKDGLLNRMIGR